MPEQPMTEVMCPPCFMCHRSGVIAMPTAAFERWRNGGDFIQVAWPEGTADEREMLISGTHPECWDSMVPKPQCFNCRSTNLVIEKDPDMDYLTDRCRCTDCNAVQDEDTTEEVAERS